MKLGNFLKKAAKIGLNVAAKSGLIPGGPIALDLVNSFLPQDKKLPETATIQDIQDTISNLPPDQQTIILSKQIDLAIVESNNWTEVAKAHEQADATGNTTRPAIALKMADLFINFAKWSFGLIIVAMSADILAGALNQETDFTQIVMDNLAWLAAAYSVPAMNVIMSYFAKRSDDKAARYAISAEQPIPEKGESGLIGTIFGVLKGR